MRPWLHLPARCCLLLALALPLGRVQGQESAGRLAVSPVAFYGRGANSLESGDPAVAAMADSILRSELERGRFQLIPPARLRDAMAPKEAGGLECVSLECRREVSRSLDAAWMVTAKLSKTSNLIWYLSGQLT